MAKRGKSPRAQVPLRIPEAIRARLERAAKAGKVSMNAEIVERLARSFELEDRFGGPRVRDRGALLSEFVKVFSRTFVR